MTTPQSLSTAGSQVSKLRLPATRAAFEEQLLRAVHGAAEANAVALECGCGARFKVVGGGEVDVQRLYSLRLEDALPHHAVKLSVAAVLLSAREVLSPSPKGAPVFAGSLEAPLKERCK
jgi:hypothetical protein